MNLTSLSQETQIVQNPALGAGLIWRFTCGYVDHHRTSDRPPMLLAFLVLPMLLHTTTAQMIKGTLVSSGLRAFAAKFGEIKNSKQDLLLALHGRVLRHRNLTLESIRIAIASHLIHVDRNGALLPLTTSRPVIGMPEESKQLMRDAEKVGAWFSQLTLHEVSTILKVRF